MWVLSLGQEDPLEQEMATHSSILAWKIPETEEPGQATVHSVTVEQAGTQAFISENVKRNETNYVLLKRI